MNLLLGFALLFTLGASRSFAFESPEKPRQENRILILGPSSEHLHFKLIHKQVLFNGRVIPDRIVEIHFEDVRFYTPENDVKVLYGLDLDHDGYYDAWFYPDESGWIEMIDYPSHDPSGWDVAASPRDGNGPPGEETWRSL